MKKIGHYLFYLIEIAIVFALYTTLQEFYFYPDIFG
ncbi:CPBP family intramembrane glutamate endopeptidase, partial [Streptococcus thermophilus]|nr:CPBP family intramembrane metalloprotease [Streptococcus thermophilus]